MNPTLRTVRQPFSLLTLILFGVCLFGATLTPAHMQGGSNQPTYTASFTDLSFSTSGDGATMTYFPVGTSQIFARWNFNNVPNGAGITLLRQWYLNGKLFIEKQEPWTLGTSGTVQNVSIYDFQSGLLPGDYSVEFYLIGHPDLMIRGYFTIS